MNNDNQIWQILHFLKTEKTIFGDFSVPEFESEKSGNTAKSDQSLSEPETGKEEYQPNKLNEISSCDSLEKLERLCALSDDLKTDLGNTNLVFGAGNRDADLMLIGEAPGADEDRLGEPFVGRAGQLLNKILKAIDLDREDVYIANILKHRPPGNRNPLPDERARSLPYLYRQIELISPKLILCLGKVAATTLLEKAPDIALGEIRKTFHPFKNAELMVTYHPAALLRHPKWKRPVWEDVKRLRERYDELGCKP